MPREDSSVLFRHPTRRLRRPELSEFLDRTARLIAPGCQVSCLLTDDRELRRLNRKFRNVNHTTDVLSFPSDRGGKSRSRSIAPRRRPPSTATISRTKFAF